MTQTLILCDSECEDIQSSEWAIKMRALSRDAFRNGLIVGYAHGDSGRVLIEVLFLEHAELLKSLIPNSEILRASDSYERRHEILISSLHSVDSKVIITTNVMIQSLAMRRDYQGIFHSYIATVPHRHYRVIAQKLNLLHKDGLMRLFVDYKIPIFKRTAQVAFDYYLKRDLELVQSSEQAHIISALFSEPKTSCLETDCVEN